MIVAASIGVGELLLVVALIGLVVYGIAFVAGRGAKRGSRD